VSRQTMSRWWIPVLLFLQVLAFPACSEQLSLLGRIAEFPVAVTLEKDGDRLEGWYFYLSKAKLIRLTGKLARDGRFHLDETASAAGSAITGVFDGTASEGRWVGAWRKSAEASPLAVELRASSKDFADKNASFRCTAQQRDEKSHDIYRSELKLGLSASKVNGLSVEQSVSGGGDEQGCSISLDDLEPVPSTSGFLLRADDDQATSSSGRCSVHIVGNERLLWIQVGDSSREGDDCRSAGETMFCSPRGYWRDIVLDRQTQKCRFLE